MPHTSKRTESNYHAVTTPSVYSRPLLKVKQKIFDRTLVIAGFKPLATRSLPFVSVGYVVVCK
jgi:hypothetical protein